MEGIEKESSEQIIQKRKEKIFSWLKKPENLIFSLIFLGIIILRFYYFWITKNQPVWWDESEYLSAAKNYAGIVDYTLSSQRLPGFPMFLSLFFMIGITSEPVLRFFAVFLPSILAIFLIYITIKEMYPDKKIALISLAIMGLLWEHMFYSNRFHTENFALIFQALAFLILFKVYLKKEKLSFITPKFSLLWILFFTFLSFFFRQGNLMIIPPLFLFIIILNKSKIFNKKTTPFVLGIFAILVISLFFLPYIKLPESGILSKKGLLSYYHPESNLAWKTISVFYGFYESAITSIPSIFYYAFLLGLLIVLFELFVYTEGIKKILPNNEDLKYKSNLFSIITITLILFYFIFIQRPANYEYRWFFPILFAMLPITAIGIIDFSNFVSSFLIKKNSLAIFLILIILGLGLYTQYSHADSITRVKLDSYSQIKEAGLWVKQNSDTGDVILSRSPHQITYYSERKTYSYGGMNETEFFNLINQVKPRYVIESALEPGLPSWMTPPSSDLEKVLLPIKAWYLDKEQKQIVLIVYQVDLTKTPNQQPVNNTDFIVNKTNSNLSSPNPLINKSNPF